MRTSAVIAAEPHGAPAPAQESRRAVDAFPPLDKAMARLRALAAKSQTDPRDVVARGGLRRESESVARLAAGAGLTDAAKAARFLAELSAGLLSQGRWDQPRIATLISFVSALSAPEITEAPEVSRALAAAAEALSAEPRAFGGWIELSAPPDFVERAGEGRSR